MSEHHSQALLVLTRLRSPSRGHTGQPPGLCFGLSMRLTMQASEQIGQDPSCLWRTVVGRVPRRQGHMDWPLGLSNRAQSAWAAWGKLDVPSHGTRVPPSERVADEARGVTVGVGGGDTWGVPEQCAALCWMAKQGQCLWEKPEHRAVRRSGHQEPLELQAAPCHLRGPGFSS